MRIVVCDVGLGNLRSVERAFLEVTRGARHTIVVTSDPARVGSADKLVMPGQGGFGDCARALSGALGDAVRAHLGKARPYLGICLGLQILFEWSEEAPGAAGLGVLAGRVVRLAGGKDVLTGAPLKIPHVGWNVAEPKTHAGAVALLPEREHFYFTHTYAVAPHDPNVVAAETEHGATFVSAVATENLFACQWHPEKSQRAGLSLLERFVAS